MKTLIQSLGIAMLGVSLLGLTSGCGKKLVRGSSGSDERIVHASLNSSPYGQQTSRSGSLPARGKIPVGQNFDLEAGEPVLESEMDITSTDIGGQNRRGAGEHFLGDSKESTRNAILTTPASTSSSRFDSPYSSLRGAASESSKQKHGLTHSKFTQSEHASDVPSGRDAKRNGVTFSKGLHDIFFQFDSWRLTEEARQNLEANAEWLKAHPHERITIEGHCDERGTQAYNYVLGEKRATMVQQYLGFLGVPQHQLIVTSFGKDKPECRAFSEHCFQKNRRAHFGSDLNVASQ